MGQGQSSGSGALAGAVTPVMMDNFHTFMQYTAAAYCNSDRMSTSTRISCGSNACPDIQAHDTHIVTTLEGYERSSGGYIALDNTAKRIVVAFHGTRNAKDWMENLKAGLVDSDLCAGCRVHGGFQDIWGDIAQTVMAVVPGLHGVHPDYSVVATGHSLGAALATLTAAHLRQRGIAVDAYLYGSPRVGNPAFAEFVNAQPGGRAYRVTHYDDPVPRLPGHLLGYAHIDTEFWLAAGDGRRTDYAPQDVLVCQGTYNKNCNSGTKVTSIDVDAHLYYLQPVNACASNR